MDFGQTGRLGSRKGGFTWPDGGVRVNRDCAPKSSIVASFVSNLSHLGSPPGRIPSGPTVLKGGSRWNLDTTRSIDSALNDIFDPFSPSRDPIRRYSPFW